MRQIEISDVKTNLSRLVDAAAEGEGFVIAKAGKPLVKVVPIDAEKPVEMDKPINGGKSVKRIGFMLGEFDVPDDFDRLCEDEIARLFGMST